MNILQNLEHCINFCSLFLERFLLPGNLIAVGVLMLLWRSMCASLALEHHWNRSAEGNDTMQLMLRSVPDFIAIFILL